MVTTYNGMPAGDLGDVRWQKSQHSNPNGACVELAALPSGEIAMRNSRFPVGPVLLYTQAEITAFLAGAKDGEFDHDTATKRNILPASSTATGRPAAPRQQQTDSVTLVTCGNTERSGLLLNCHRSPFRRHEMTWETGPHPARLRV